MQKSRLFTLLPEAYVCTPDGMEIDRNGDLILSCPNYAMNDMSGCVVKHHTGTSSASPTSL